MSGLIEDLKKEHREIAQMLERVTGASIGSELGRQMLFTAKKGLLAHLEREDRELYPALKRAAEKDAGLNRMLDVFAKDLEDISGTTIAFFDKYAEASEGLDFAKDFGRMVAALRNRIGREENILYQRYAELANKGFSD